MMRTLFINPEGRLRSGWRIVVTCLLIVAAVAIVNVAWRGLDLPGMREGGGWWFLVFAGLVSGCMLAIVLASLRLLEGTDSRAICMPFDATALRMTMLGIVIGALPIALFVLTVIVGGFGTLEPAGPTLAGLGATMLPLLVAGFLLAAWEELVLRGYLLRQFSLGINTPAAIVITGVLFGLMHAANPGANWEGLLYTAVGGMLMGWLVLRSGSLWLLIGYHFGWNAIASAVFGLEVSGFEQDASVLSTTLEGPDWVTGGSYGFEAALPTVLAEFAVLAIALWLFGNGRRYAHRQPVARTG